MIDGDTYVRALRDGTPTWKKARKMLRLYLAVRICGPCGHPASKSLTLEIGGRPHVACLCGGKVYGPVTDQDVSAAARAEAARALVELRERTGDPIPATLRDLARSAPDED